MKINLALIVLTSIIVVHGINNEKSPSSTSLRGTMISPHLEEQDYRVLRNWNANHIRWQLLWAGFPHGPADNATVSEYEEWLESILEHLDSLIPVFHEFGIKILLDLHTPPGGRDQNNKWPLFYNQTFQDTFLTVWEKMANRYKNETQIMGYDLVNEPNDQDLAPGLLSWRDLAIAAIQRIRVIDTLHPIIVEASPNGGVTSLPTFEPLPFDNLIYSFHMYQPFKFVLQGIYSNVTTPVYYPGIIDGIMWNKEALRTVMQPTVDWQNAHNVSIHIGEFSAIRWAPGNSTCNYLNDCIELFEEYGWNWDYHAFREWQGWDVEMIGDKDHPQHSPVPTDRQLLLMEWFKKNEHMN
jgi:aryl-phospho-beta-D-glucosidase BglC (GH1 family)